MIIAFPIIPWSFLWQRPQQLLSRLARRGYPVLYLAPINENSFKASYPNCDQWPYPNLTLISENLFHLWCRSKNPIDIHHKALSDEEIKELIQSIAPVIDGLEASDLYYLVQHPGWGPLVKQLTSLFPGKIIYDCMDDHSGFQGVPPGVLLPERSLIASCDLVFASSHLLLEKVGSINSSCRLLQNAADFDAFSRTPSSNVLSKHKNSKIIGYFGCIKEWFDFELLQYASQERPNYTFIIIGSFADKERNLYSFSENVHFLGRVEYSELPKYLAAFDVCMIPFRLIPLTLATNPVKFYEYLSAGKPVVSVNLPELAPYKDICYLANSKDEFVSSLDKAANEVKSNSAMLCQERINVAKNNSWDNRVETFIKELESLCDHKESRDVIGYQRRFRKTIEKLGSFYLSELAHNASVTETKRASVVSLAASLSIKIMALIKNTLRFKKAGCLTHRESSF